jgi:hypothetical protein
MNSIQSLRQQLEIQQRELSLRKESIQHLTQLVEEEKIHTLSLIEKSQAQPQTEATVTKEPTLSKVEKIAKMTDRQLLDSMGSRQKVENLLKDL